jgi:hypothetical protein
MIVLLQLLSVLVPGALALMFLALTLGPFLSTIGTGRSFTIKWQHVAGLAISTAIAIALAAAYGWVALP